MTKPHPYGNVPSHPPCKFLKPVDVIVQVTWPSKEPSVSDYLRRFMRNSFVIIAVVYLSGGATIISQDGITPIGEQGGAIALGANGFTTLPGLTEQLQGRGGIGLGQQGSGTTIGEQGASVPPMISTPQFDVNARGGLTPLGEQGGTIAFGAGGFTTLPGVNPQLQQRGGIGLGQQGSGTTIGEQGASIPARINTPQFDVNTRGGLTPTGNQGSGVTIGPQGSTGLGRQGSGTTMGPQTLGTSSGSASAAARSR
jgi:hypothetical protein